MIIRYKGKEFKFIDGRLCVTGSEICMDMPKELADYMKLLLWEKGGEIIED